MGACHAPPRAAFRCLPDRAGVAGGVGCKVVTGQHDCLYDPSAAQLPAPDGRPMFPVVGGDHTPAGTVVVTPPPASLPVVEKK